MIKKIPAVFLCLTLIFQSFHVRANNDSLLVHNGQRLFLSGMNLAWMNFGNDLGSFNEALFTQRVESLAAAGGNTIRWWLHTNGRYSPQFTDGVVSGINPVELTNLQKALDIAYERGVLLMLCLWSFDMLQPNAQEANWSRNRALLEDSVKTRAYINNALIPLVEAVKGHPGIAAWEIFNEPEGMINGFGWTPQKVNFIHVQRFVNMTVGAIKRVDPDTKVSNGSWNIRVLTDIGSFTNYYRDDRLIAAGGDPDGVLDFYMVHYYPQHFGANQSPFHNHASHWQLNKPIVIAEFPSLGINLSGRALTPLQAYQFAMENGYAGALSWTMTGHDGNGGLPESAPAMTYLQENYPDIIKVEPDPDFPYPPYIKGLLNPLFFPMQEEKAVIGIVDLKSIFGHINEGMPLEFSVFQNQNPNLLAPFITQSDSLMVEVSGNLAGFGQIAVKATDTLGKSILAHLAVSVYDPDSEDVLLFRSAFASSNENPGHSAMYAIDGNAQSRWSSEYSDNHWLAVEMEEVKTIQRVMLRWETAFGREYSIDVSEDGEEWTTVYHEPFGNGGWDKILFEPVDAKYIRMNGIKRATTWGFSLWSFQAFKNEGDNTAPQFTGTFRDTIARAGEAYNVAIPLGIVTDPDQGERLLFSVSLADSDQLPHWLSFDQITRTLSGLPTVADIGDVYHMQIVVTDMSSESDYYYFNLVVESGTNVFSLESKIPEYSLFPNPVQSMLYLRKENAGPEKVNLRVVSVNGQLMGSWLFDTHLSDQTSIDVSFLKSGIYFLEVVTNYNTHVFRFARL
jgi:hypothetical protein